MTDVLALPFDQYQRYRLVADIVERLREDGRALSILDVGGRTGLLGRFLERDRLTLVDTEPDVGRERLVLGDGCRLPFADGAFDLVCAFDTLEHVPPGAREAFVSESRRVARRWVVLAGPYDAPRVNAAEARLKEFMLEKLHLRHRYLEEHAAHGLPDRAAVERQLASLGGRVTRLGHANLDRWLVLMCLSMYLDDDAALRPLAASFFEFYNASLYASDHAPPVYRHAIVAALGDAPLPELEGLLAPPAAPAGSLAAVEELATGLLAFDRERAVWRTEREAFEKSVEELTRDLALEKEDRAKLAAEFAAHREEAEAQAAEQAEVERGLRADLAAKLAVLDEARNAAADAEERRAALELELADVAARLDEHRAVLADREARLAEHKEVLADREALLAKLRATLLGRTAIKLVAKKPPPPSPPPQAES